MKVSVEGTELVIRIDIKPEVSKSGKSTTLATTHGNKPTVAMYQGENIILGVNAYVPK